MPLPLLVLLPVIFGAADFITGRDFIKRMGLPGRSIWWVAPILMVFFLLTAGKMAVLVPFTWALWRSVLGWSSFGGSLNPNTSGEILSLEGRNLVSGIPFWLVMTLGFGINTLFVALVVGAFCSLAMLVNVWLSYEAQRGRDIDPQVDTIHGALFGLTVLALLLAQAGMHHG